MLKIKTRVKTNYGTGTIIGYDKTSQKCPRYEIKLDTKPQYHDSRTLYFFMNEVEVDENSNYKPYK